MKSFSRGRVMFTEENFNKLIEMHKDTVYRIALNYTKSIDAAEDITQNVWIIDRCNICGNRVSSCRSSYL